jgi:hypothetical protein
MWPETKQQPSLNQADNPRVAGPLISPIIRLEHHGRRQIHRNSSRYWRNFCYRIQLYRYKKGGNALVCPSKPLSLPNSFQGLNAVAKHTAVHESASEYRYLINPLWWAGIILSLSHFTAL